MSLTVQAALIAIEDSSERARNVICALLKGMTSSNVITPEQFKKVLFYNLPWPTLLTTRFKLSDSVLQFDE